MDMEKDMSPEYEALVERKAQEVFDVMNPRVGEADMARLRAAFELARKMHSKQKRKTGEPYILHPIAVAMIAASDLNMDVNTVIAAFLHDVVEDTPVTITNIREQFGDDVAFLVKVVTKQKKEKYEVSKQLDNFRQMLNSVQYDIRALLLKLADRLHNMRTLASMRADKQMKIAGETDYFYAPLANRLGLYDVKTELENLSLRFRCPYEYEELESAISRDREATIGKLEIFADTISEILGSHGIGAEVKIVFRKPYSLWRKMLKTGDDFDHLRYRSFVDVIFESQPGVTDKDLALRIYSLLTDKFKEKPGGIVNYIDSPKESGYRSFHVKLLTDFGRWQEVHISSRKMSDESRKGCVADGISQSKEQHWVEKFRGVLRDIASQGRDFDFVENVVASFYNDDIMTFTPQGKPIVLPKNASAIDFAYEVHTQVGRHAKYAKINGRIASIKTRLHRGDVVEIFTDENCEPEADWLENSVSYKVRKDVTALLLKRPLPEFKRCSCCSPIPGEEVVGFDRGEPQIEIHKRDCPVAIRMAAREGDSIKTVDFKATDTLYPVTVNIRAVDRAHLMMDLVDSISNDLNLCIDAISTDRVDAIVNCHLAFGVHSYAELQKIIGHISTIDGVDEVKHEK